MAAASSVSAPERTLVTIREFDAPRALIYRAWTDPAQFARWFQQAATEAHLFEPNAMVVSTANAEGHPTSRTVLLKHFDEQGFVFYTNYDSRKARDLAQNPYVCLLFPWHPINPG